MKNSMFRYIAFPGCAIIACLLFIFVPDDSLPSTDGQTAPPAGWRILKCHESETYTWDRPVGFSGSSRFKSDQRESSVQGAIDKAWAQYEFGRFWRKEPTPVDTCKWVAVAP